MLIDEISHINAQRRSSNISCVPGRTASVHRVRTDASRDLTAKISYIPQQA